MQAVQEQKGILESQNLTLEEQVRLILNAQAALKQKEADLAAAQQELTAAQQELTAAQQELSGAQRTLTAAQQELKTQQQVMDTQQKRLDDLVGVRTRIIQELSNELSQAKLKASVDRNTGDIMLQSAVFFDVGKDEIKALEAAGLKDVIVIGFDAVDDAVAAVKAGNMKATVAQKPSLIGSMAVETAVAHIKGEAVQKQIPVPLELVK